MNATIARNLVTDFDGTTLVNYHGTDIASGFTLTEVDGGWEIHDGTTAATVTDPTEALRTYADFIQTHLDDQDDETAATWAAEITKARLDAATI